MGFSEDGIKPDNRTPKQLMVTRLGQILPALHFIRLIRCLVTVLAFVYSQGPGPVVVTVTHTHGAEGKRSCRANQVLSSL